MQYILEFFDFLKRNEQSPNLSNWKDKIEFVYKKYKEIKIKSPKGYYFLEASVDDNGFDICFTQYINKNKIDIHLYFKNKDGQYEVSDFSEVDLYDPKNKKGNYNISKDEYDKYYPYVKEISDFLDDKSDKEYNKSSSFISDTGDINIDKSNIVIDELNYELENKIFNKYIGKEFEFEMSYHLIKSKEEHYENVERRTLKINEIRVEFSGSRFYINVYTKGVFGEDCYFWIESDTKPEYYDLNTKFKSFKDLIKMYIIKPEQSRRQERENIQKYPYTISYDISPSKYNTIEFIKEMVELLVQMNNQIKKDDL